ncbi:mechanosensitive ion channel family protein [Amantichitinum ursilacus]|uniref:Small-conductance mechanosensitive channel n=1 Tax=Amantichitinum ursilacus TaxID=857265 RepID=A0A0N0GLG9_9NEIS|nr:mechanosensitive ion channel family protein [Amantichitinum ursilacus]KPC49895.1 Low conductance mechanosensitive channel YnaI [Amantichitinum ursilacus]
MAGAVAAKATQAASSVWSLAGRGPLFSRRILTENEVGDFLFAGFIVVVALVLFWLVRKVLVRWIAPRLRKRQKLGATAIAESFRATSIFVLFPVALYLGGNNLELPARLETLLAVLAMAGITLQVALWANRMLTVWFSLEAAHRPGADAETATALAVIGFICRAFLWAFIVLLVMDQLGFNISALVAGLGIGGVAVALALQHILGDIFASLAIVLDKPFVVGDFIIVEDMLGNIERVGIKTTRIRSLAGEQIVLSNDFLLKSKIRNYQKMQERRVLFTFTVTYRTPKDKLARIDQIVRDAILAQDQVRMDRAHLLGFANHGYLFEVVFFVLSGDYNLYMDIQQKVNLAMVEAFDAEGIGFAIPVQAVYHEGGVPMYAAGAAGSEVGRQ